MQGLKLKSNYSNSVYDFLYQEIFVEFIYSFETKSSAPVVVDCGANIGLAVAFFKFLYPNSIVHAFEPHAQTFELLSANIDKLGFDHVFLINKALGRKVEMVGLYEPEDDVLKLPVMSLFKNSYASKRVEVEMINFGNYILGITGADCCKMDVEGAESDLILSLLESKAIQLVNCYIIEYHHWVKQCFSLDDVINIFTNNGFFITTIKYQPPFDSWPISEVTVIKCVRI